MGLTDEHYKLMREHFYALFGKKCKYCNESDINKMHFHHKSGKGHILNGENGRGRERRIWNLFIAYSSDDLEMLCKNCHIETENYGVKNNV